MTFLMATTNYRGYACESGSGAYIFTGKDAVLDFFSDTGTASLGYNHPAHIEALQRIATERIPIHLPNIVLCDERERAAERLCGVTGMDKVFFCNSGTESVEAAIKLARLYHFKKQTGRNVICSYRGGFHGRTYASIAASDGPAYYTEGFLPMPGGLDSRFESLSEIPANAAAVLMAPVNGHHDVRTYPSEWFQELRTHTNRHDILLIFDEVQSGSGRCGAWNYGRKIGVLPDITCLAKGMAGGFPMGAMLARGEVASTFEPGHHFSTFGGSPIACVFLNAMLDWLTPSVQRDIEAKGRIIRDVMCDIPWLSNVRGTGMMWGADCRVDAVELAKGCDEKSLIIGAWRPTPLKIAPPLVASEEDIRKGLKIMSQIGDALYQGAQP